jgi:hypothetical protein
MAYGAEFFYGKLNYLQPTNYSFLDTMFPWIVAVVLETDSPAGNTQGANHKASREGIWLAKLERGSRTPTSFQVPLSPHRTDRENYFDVNA